MSSNPLFRAVLMAAAILGVAMPAPAWAGADFTVYSVYRSLDMGSGESPEKDFYVNMGSANGVTDGMALEVYRKIPSYDVANEKLYKDVTFPIARLKVIHVEPNAAIARLDKMLPPTKMPAISPYAVMIGDIVRVGE